MDNNIIKSFFACPKCGREVGFEEKGLSCGECRLFFSNNDGIYRLLEGKLSDYDAEQEEVFDKVHSAYDEYLNNHPFYKLIRDDYVLPFWFKEDFSDKVVLDLGCGTGWASSAILQKASLLVNLDISSGNLKFTKRKIGKDKAIYVHADMKRLPFLGEKFDIVTCFGAMHHISNPIEVIKGIRRVLKNGGLFFGIEPNIRYTWVEFWSDTLRLPLYLKRKLIGLHKIAQRHTGKRLDKEEYYMKGIRLRHDHHGGLIDIAGYRSMFLDLSFDFEFKPIGLEFVPPRFFMSKNEPLVKSLIERSEHWIKTFKKSDKAYFNIIKARKI